MNNQNPSAQSVTIIDHATFQPPVIHMTDEPKQQIEHGKFQYSGMHPSDINFLKNAASTLQKKVRSSAVEMIDAGEILETAKEKLGPGLWKSWLQSEAQLSLRSAERLRAVASVFDKIDPEVLDRFTPTALYTLSESRVPQSHRKRAVELAMQGQTVTAGMVRGWVDAMRQTAMANDEETMPASGGLTLTQERENDAAKAQAEENWLLLDQLLKNDSMLHLRAAGTEHGERLVEGHLLPDDGKRQSATGKGVDGLESVILELANQVLLPLHLAHPVGSLRAWEPIKRKLAT